MCWIIIQISYENKYDEMILKLFNKECKMVQSGKFLPVSFCLLLERFV